jgi:hypothetical protein
LISARALLEAYPPSPPVATKPVDHYQGWS